MTGSGSARRPAGPVALVGALGVVFGDIGTSPLYAMRTILGETDHVDREVVYGLTSTVIWALLLVVTVLYVGTLLRTDNEGEGGLLALLGLLRGSGVRRGWLAATTILAMLGAGLFLGDSVVTPAISVLAAAEGMEVASPSLKVAVLPVALAILLGVFVLQRVGSGRIGAFYGPVMVVWFAVLAAGGAWSLASEPAALGALSPHWAVMLLLDDPLPAFLSWGAVILAVTGAEALYADLGHFGRRAIARAWLLVVLPALVLAYLGEAAAVLRDSSAATQPFYAVVPGWATLPVLVVATLATVIASEAVIAGAFTVLHQAGGLGLFPFLRTRHPSAKEGGRIYLPAANWTMAAAVLLVMLFFLATLPKVIGGGWAPVGIGAVVFVVMWTWRDGQRRLAAARREQEGTPQELLAGLDPALHRTPQLAVFLTDDEDVVPFALRTVIESTQVLPERVVLLRWQVVDTPTSAAHQHAVEVERYDDERVEGVVAVDVTLGYRERLSVGHVLETACEEGGLDQVRPDDATYFLSESIPRLKRGGGLALWRQRLFLLLDRLATDRVEQLALPRDRTVVIGRELDL